MVRLPRADLERLLEFVHEAARLERERPFTPDVLRGLRDLVPADRVTYCELDWDRRRTRLRVGCDGEAANADEGSPFWRLHHEHPVCEHYGRTGDRRPLKMSDFLTQRQLHQLELYDTIWRPLGIAYELDVRIPSGRPIEKMFMFQLEGASDFSERDRLVLDLLRPHLQRIDERFHARARSSHLPLTGRELEVLDCVRRGETNAQIAQTLWISPGTVRKHLENIYDKLGVGTRTAAVARLNDR